MVKMSADTLRLAIILGIVLPGVGHMYLGQVNRGIKVLLLVILTGTISGALISYVNFIIQQAIQQQQTIQQQNPTGPTPENEARISQLIYFTNIMNLLPPSISLIPLIVWIWQIRDLRRIIRKLTGHSVEELEPPHLQVESTIPNDGIICHGCGKRVSKESVICDNCGLKL